MAGAESEWGARVSAKTLQGGCATLRNLVSNRWLGLGGSPGGFKQRLVWLDLDLEALLELELWAGASPGAGF